MAREATGAGRTGRHVSPGRPDLDHDRHHGSGVVDVGGSVAAGMAAVDVESLTITYGDVTAVDDLSFRAEAGEVTCVLGPNGAGKTSTIEALEGLRRPAAGRLSVVGLDPRADHRALTARIGVMLQEGGIHPAVRVHEAVRHAAALYPDPARPRGAARAARAGRARARPYRRLSGGEQRRLALALALVGPARRWRSSTSPRRASTRPAGR